MAVYRVVKSSDYATIATFHLRDDRLRLADKGLLSLLLAEGGDEAYTIADLAGRGPEGKDAIAAALKRLEAAGYIRRRQSHDGSGRFGAVEMLIYESPLPKNTETAEPSTEKALPGRPLPENSETVPVSAELELNHRLDTTYRGESVDPVEKEEENIKSPHKSPRKDAGTPAWKPDVFAAFWGAYPRHESKQAAKRAWDKLRADDALLRTMGRALAAQKKSDLWQRGIGIPYASTWLNQRRWEDELAAAPQPHPRIEESPDVQLWRPGVVG